MGLIRVGFFEGFKGADTLLIDVNAGGLRGLITWLHEVMSSRRPIPLTDCPGVALQPGTDVQAFCVCDDAGLLRTGERAFAWHRSADGWTDVVDKLAAMQTGGCHQYLDGLRDDVQVIASIGEYGDEWWRRHGS
jgi:hypothetical protein